MTQFNYKLKKAWTVSLGLEPGRQNGRHRQMYRAMAVPLDFASFTVVVGVVRH